MGEPSISMTFQEMYQETSYYLFNTRSPSGDQLVDSKQYVNDGYRHFLAGKDPRTNVIHKWNFMEPETEITVWADQDTAANTVTSTGTTLDSDGGTELFFASMVGQTITIATVDYTIVTYNSATQIVLSADPSAVAKAYTINTDGSYGLPDDFGWIVDDFAYSRDETAVLIQPISLQAIKRMESGNDSTGLPLYYAVFVRPFTSTTGSRYDVRFWPEPSGEYTFRYRYHVNPSKMTADAEYPLGSALHAQTVLQAGKYIADTNKHRNSTASKAMYDELMITSIQADSQIASKTIGYNGNWKSGNFQYEIYRNAVTI
jgi:hypothetical protein